MILSAVRTRQPEAAVEIDRNCPLTRNLITAMPLSVRAYDAVDKGNQISLINSPPMGGNVEGIGPVLNGSNQSISLFRAFVPAAGTLLLYTYLNAMMTGSACPACQSSDAAGSSIGLGWQGSSFNVAGAGIATVADVGLRMLVGTWDANTKESWVDAQLAGTASGATPTGTASYPFNIGCFYYSGGRIFFFPQVPLLFCAWDRRLQAEEIKELYRNPWQIFKSPKPLIAKRMAGGGGVTFQPAWASQSMVTIKAR